MTYIDGGHIGNNLPLEGGRIHAYLDNLFCRLKGIDQVDYSDSNDQRIFSDRSPVERCLAEIQKTVSSFSMHLPQGFGPGLSKQFANMLDEDAWEEEDELPQLSTLSTFLNMLLWTGAQRRPGIGTNGRGSITAFWRTDGNRLTVDCLPTGEISWVLTASNNEGERERAAGICTATRLPEVLVPYNPRIWFDQ